MSETIIFIPDVTEDCSVFYEPLSCRYFVSTDEEVKKTIDEANNLVGIKWELKINDWFDILGIPRIALGDYAVFDISDGHVRFWLTDEKYDTKICRNVKTIECSEVPIPFCL